MEAAGQRRDRKAELGLLVAYLLQCKSQSNLFRKFKVGQITSMVIFFDIYQIYGVVVYHCLTGPTGRELSAHYIFIT